MDCRKIRVVFNGQHPTSEPVIASMAMSEGIAASILYASSKMIGNKVYGSMVLGLPDDETAVKRALAFLSEYENIIAEEVTEMCIRDRSYSVFSEFFRNACASCIY